MIKYFIYIIYFLLFIQCKKDAAEVKQNPNQELNQAINVNSDSIQDSVLSQKIDPISFSNIATFNIGQLEQFTDRFNGDDTAFTNFNDPQFKKRVFQMYTLFDTAKHALKPLIDEFVNEQINGQFRELSIEDKHCFARVTFSGTYDAKPILCSILLRINETSMQTLEWIAVGATISPSFLPHGFDKTDCLNPAAQNLGFNRLLSMVSDKNTVFNVVERGFELDLLSIVLSNLYSEKILLSSKKSVEIWFLQIPNWIFRVKDIPRLSYSSGWLIDTLFQSNDIQKRKFCYQKLGISKTYATF